MTPSIKKRPTLQDIGDRLGLSKRAVSQALNERQSTVKVSEATRQRVQAMALKLGYRQNMAAKALTTGRSGMYGVLSFQNLIHLSAIRLRLATEALKKRGVVPFLLQCNEATEEGCMRSVETLIDAGVDGVLLMTPGIHFGPGHLQRLRDFGIPVVRMGGGRLQDIPTVHVNRAQGFELLTRHLLARGYRSFTVLLRQVTSGITPYLARTPQETIEGIRAAIKAQPEKVELRTVELAEQEADPPATEASDVHILYAPGYTGMKKIIASGEIPDALICQADGWALGAMRACSEAGITIPEDMALTGYGNDPVGSATYVPLTTIGEPIAELCETAVSELLSLVGGNAPSWTEKTIPSRLYLRQSTLGKSSPGPAGRQDA